MQPPYCPTTATTPRVKTRVAKDWEREDKIYEDLGENSRLDVSFEDLQSVEWEGCRAIKRHRRTNRPSHQRRGMFWESGRSNGLQAPLIPIFPVAEKLFQHQIHDPCAEQHGPTTWTWSN